MNLSNVVNDVAGALAQWQPQPVVDRGAALANEGLTEMTSPSVQTPADSCTIGLNYLHSIQQQAQDPRWTQIATTTKAAYDAIVQLDDSPFAGYATLRSALRIIGSQTPAPMGIALAKVGAGAMDESDVNMTPAEACEIGLTFAHAINDNPYSDATEKSQAFQALAAYDTNPPGPNSASSGAGILANFLNWDANRA